MIGPMGDCGIGDQRTKIRLVSEIGSPLLAPRKAADVGIYNWKRS
jgi:hypothetical protein